MSLAGSPYSGTSPIATLFEGGGPVTLVEGQTFALSGPNGDMSSEHPHGLFVRDTRVVSRWELRVNGHQLESLAVETPEPFTATFAARGHAARGHADADLVMFRRRHIGSGMREVLELTNHGLEAVPVVVELTCDADFADLFEVKEGRVPPGRARSIHIEGDALRFDDHDDRNGRATTLRLASPTIGGKRTATATVEPGTAVWRTVLDPNETWRTCIEVLITIRGEQLEPRFGCEQDDAEAVPAQRLERWRATVPYVTSDDPVLESVLARSGEDLGALRIFDPEHPGLPVVAAGAPWFMTVFGRDSLITAWMSLMADRTLAEGVLQTLARFQGEDVDDSTEEEPGKILHEMRFASASGLSLDRGDVYYGSIDATPLFVMLLGELRRWNEGDELVDQLMPHADRALEWIQTMGDRDGDGYVEYQRKRPDGLANQGWKDSWDAVRHADGTLARAPIALCEVQGYVYAAYLARAHFADEARDDATKERYVRLALDLRRRFNEDFWDDELGTYAMALDGDKRRVAVAASNVGHCLWTGIVDVERAPFVARRLMDGAGFSGWGVRTLSESARSFNPVSYHNGSVWPHDNALCAAGLARYGLVEEAHRVICAQLDVASVHQGRLPELFAGFSRGELSVPAAYPTSCSPQAWAAAAPLLWLRTILRFDPWAPRGQIWVAPWLPEGVGRLHVSGIAVGGAQLSIEVDEDGVAVHGADGYEVVEAPRAAQTSLLG